MRQGCACVAATASGSCCWEGEVGLRAWQEKRTKGLRLLHLLTRRTSVWLCLGACCRVWWVRTSNASRKAALCCSSRQLVVILVPPCGLPS